MSVKYLTVEQHREVLKSLVETGKHAFSGSAGHPAGMEYTSLMVCFLMHSISVAETLLQLSTSLGDQWFPATVGYTIVRPMFEIDVTAHYITKAPAERARQYIEFGAIITKRQMQACAKHRKSNKPSWQEGMGIIWHHEWASREAAVCKKFDAVSSQFTRKNGKVFNTWSGKSISQMANEVDHVEAYDIFYSELSSFTHANVHLVDRFLQDRTDGLVWSRRANEFDVGNVFRHAALFLTCFMELFGREFKTWSESDIESCWKINLPEGHKNED